MSFDRGEALDRILPLFWKRGFSSVSLDELAAAAGLNRPNLTAAFGDKRDMYLASLDRFLSKFATGTAQALDGSNNLWSGLENFFDFAVSLYAEEGLGCFVFDTAPAESGHDKEIQAELAKALQFVQGTLEQRVAKAAGAELAAGSDAQGIAIALTGVLLMLALQARAGVSAVQLRQLHRRAVSSIMKNAAPN